jgi:hypothetical protein
MSVTAPLFMTWAHGEGDQEIKVLKELNEMRDFGLDSETILDRGNRKGSFFAALSL